MSSKHSHHFSIICLSNILKTRDLASSSNPWKGRKQQRRRGCFWYMPNSGGRSSWKFDPHTSPNWWRSLHRWLNVTEQCTVECCYIYITRYWCFMLVHICFRCFIKLVFSRMKMVWTGLCVHMYGYCVLAGCLRVRDRRRVSLAC